MFPIKTVKWKYFPLYLVVTFYDFWRRLQLVYRLSKTLVSRFKLTVFLDLKKKTCSVASEHAWLRYDDLHQFLYLLLIAYVFLSQKISIAFTRTVKSSPRRPSFWHCKLLSTVKSSLKLWRIKSGVSGRQRYRSNVLRSRPMGHGNPLKQVKSTVELAYRPPVGPLFLHSPSLSHSSPERSSVKFS